MRSPHAEILFVRTRNQFRFPPHRAPQDRVDQGAALRSGELDRFVNRRMLRRPEEKKLIDSQTQQITRIMIEMLGAQAADPEIEQGQIAQRAAEKFSGEGAVSRGEIAGPEQSREDRVREVLA